MSVIFIGSQTIGYECLAKIIELGIKVDAVFTFTPDQHETWEQSVDFTAKKNNIPLFFPESLSVEKIKSLNPELILVVGYRKLFPQEILDIPKFGVIGLHASALPHLRGQAPLNWAIINGDSEAGITMFFMNRGIDSGDIIAQKKTKIQDSDNKIIIATYGVASVGINIPRIFNLVLVESGKSFVRVIQSIGRGIRKAQDKDFVQIWDITSTAKFSKRHLAKRKKFYDEAKYPFNINKVNYRC